jgi:hypothetical protein
VLKKRAVNYITHSLITTDNSTSSLFFEDLILGVKSHFHKANHISLKYC